MSDESPTVSEIVASLPDRKSRSDPLWTRIFYRPLSFVFTWVFLRLPFSANQVSMLSIVVTIVGGGLTSTGDPQLILLGLFCFILFGILDGVDGNIARYRGKTSEAGEWIDALGGYLTYTSIFIGVGYGIASTSTANISSINLITLCAVGATANLLMRLEYQRMPSKESDTSSASLSNKIDKNSGITGFMIPILFFGQLLDYLTLFIILYSLFYIVAFIFTTVKISISLTES